MPYGNSISTSEEKAKNNLLKKVVFLLETSAVDICPKPLVLLGI
jgi:hypothetical protein